MSSVINENTQFIDESTGEPIVNGYIYIGVRNQDPKVNPQTIYADRDFQTTLANPQRTGADGRSVNKIWVDGRYSLKVESAANELKLTDLDAGEAGNTGISALTNVVGVDAITADGSPFIPSLKDGQIYTFKAAGSNTGAVTLSIDGLTAKGVKKQHDSDLDPGDFETNMIVSVAYNSVDDTFELISNVLASDDFAKVGSISALLSASTSRSVIAEGYHTNGDGGGGMFYWDASADKADHNGGTIIDPDITFPADWTNQTQLATWFTAGTGTGCWIRVWKEVYARDFGAKYDGTTNDLKSHQAAVDFAETQTYSPQGAEPVYLASGKTVWGQSGDTTGLDLQKSSLIGKGSFSTQINWGGDVDGTVIRYEAWRHKKIVGMRIDYNSVSARPKMYIDCTWEPSGGGISYTMDWGDTFDDVFFNDTSSASGGCCINLPDVTNLHMTNMRFQYAPNLIRWDVPQGASANRVLSIDGWTADLHNSAFSHSDQPSALFYVDMTGSAIVTLVLRNARVEMTDLDMTGNKAIVEVTDTKGPNAIPASGLSVVLENIGIQFSTATGVSLVYQDTTQTTVTSDISMDNCWFDGVDQIHGGNWSAFYPTPEPSSFSPRIKFWRTGRTNAEGVIQIGAETFNMDGTYDYGRGSSLYDFSIDGGAVGGMSLPGDNIPDNATITRAWYEVITAFTSGGSATVGFGVSVDDTTGLKAATIYNDATYAVGYGDFLPDGTAANFTTKTTGRRDIWMIVAGAALTGGKVRVWYDYVISE